MGAQAQALAEAKEEANETTALTERLGVDLEAQAQALAKYKEGAARRREEADKTTALAKELGVDVEAQAEALAKFKRRAQADDGPAAKRRRHGTCGADAASPGETKFGGVEGGRECACPTIPVRPRRGM